MRRRDLIMVLGSATVLVARTAHGEWPSRERPARIGCLFVNYPDGPLYLTFFDALREHGLIDGENIVIVRRFAEGRLETLPKLAAELVAAKVDLIVTSSTQGALAARAATGTLPIVVAIIGDPVADGFGTSLARPTANITGGSLIIAEIVEKRLALLKEAVPTLSRVALLAEESLAQEATSILVPRAEVMRSLDLRLDTVTVVGGDFERAFEEAVAIGVQGLFEQDSPTFNSPGIRALLAELSLRYRLPGSFHEAAYVRDGLLMSYGPDFFEMFRRAAGYVEKILKGAKPADLPFEQATKFVLAINLKTAKALGLTIPPTILAGADEVIE
jgi:putative tryptophan/tyrosine transport system substrate-binding protein